jgi:hypothetical protein
LFYLQYLIEVSVDVVVDWLLMQKVKELRRRQFLGSQRQSAFHLQVSIR